MTAHKIGTLVAIPIKGRKLVNRTGGKQSPYVQLKLGEQKKRTRASLIASVEPEWDQEVRLDVFQDQLDMKVSIFDEGKKGELVGDGVLLLNEVIDKGELDGKYTIDQAKWTLGGLRTLLGGTGLVFFFSPHPSLLQRKKGQGSIGRRSTWQGQRRARQGKAYSQYFLFFFCLS
ncbi:MAG: hypothetical protein J3R72DRAFT_71716 [Linnemannia gamsii]|nr:MAG: hypothetical protein J3R72DRAFT_71716 [Linnemannia gamsii]